MVKLELMEKKLDHLMETIDVPLVRVIMDMELNGVNISQSALQTFCLELTDRMSVLEKKAYEISGYEFNMQSPKQLRTLFFVFLSHIYPFQQDFKV